MKLVHLLSGAFAVAAVALACGCSTASTRAPLAANATNIPNVAGTTELMSAELPGPAPKVGKAHLVVDSDDLVGSSQSDDSAPKEARRSDGSHRSGAFGTSK